MSLPITRAFRFAHAANPIATRNQAGRRAEAPGASAAQAAGRKIRLAGLLALLAGVWLPGWAAYIDNFAVGPQSYVIETGQATAEGTVSGLDTNQVLWGSRYVFFQTDQHDFCRCRPLGAGDITVTVIGASPGSCNVQVAELLLEGESAYAPFIYLNYPFDGSALDWSDLNRIVIHFTSPPTTDMSVQAWVHSDTAYWYASSTALTGTNSLTFLFIGLLANDGTACTGINVEGCSFSFSPPMSDSFVIGDIQVLATPSLSAVQGEGGLTLTWPTNAVGFVLQHTTNMAQSFIPVAGNPVVVGTNYSVAIPCARAAEFFCLKLDP